MEPFKRAMNHINTRTLPLALTVCMLAGGVAAYARSGNWDNNDNNAHFYGNRYFAAAQYNDNGLYSHDQDIDRDKDHGKDKDKKYDHNRDKDRRDADIRAQARIEADRRADDVRREALLRDRIRDEARDQARLDAQARFEAHRDALRDMMLARGEYTRTLDRQTRELIRERARLNAEEQARIDADLAAGQPLPAWAMNQAVFLPQSLNSYYGYPSNYRIGVLGNNSFVYNNTSGQVLDVIRNLLGI